MIDWFLQNLDTLVLVTIVLACAGYSVYSYFTQPSNKRKELMVTWMLHAVIEAEKLFKSKSGKLKFSYVYSMFVKQFPIISKFLPLPLFEELVEEALAQMKVLLESNDSIKKYVEGE